MNNIDIQALNDKFHIASDSHSVVIQPGQGEMPVIEVKNPQASARIALHGAHLLSWIPEGEQEVIWLSRDAGFAVGKSVRGGIPVCWPWFGAHDSETTYPAHGFARYVYWQIERVDILDDGRTQIEFTLPLPGEYRHMWPAGATLEYRLIIGSTLQLQLQTYNWGEQAFTITEALHTYFKVANISRVTLYGLEQTDYLDKLEGFREKTQQGPITVDGSVDRVYLGTTADCIIDDAKLDRKIHIHKQGSHSTVVWNPWRETAAKMGDLGPSGYQQMLCVESANVAPDRVTILPGESHTLEVIYSL